MELYWFLQLLLFYNLTFTVKLHKLVPSHISSNQKGISDWTLWYFSLARTNSTEILKGTKKLRVCIYKETLASSNQNLGNHDYSNFIAQFQIKGQGIIRKRTLHKKLVIRWWDRHYWWFARKRGQHYCWFNLISCHQGAIRQNPLTMREENGQKGRQQTQPSLTYVELYEIIKF